MEFPYQTDFIVVGTGVAGLRTAISLAEHGKVLAISKEKLTESNTNYAQGGIAVAFSDDDEIELHLQDTINAGDGIVNAEAARILVGEGPERIQELIDWGTEFDRSGPKLIFTREAAHSRSRVLHAHGDSTGQEIARALTAKARSLPNITFIEHAFTLDALVSDGRVCGVTFLDQSGKPHSVAARAVLLGTGGAGQVYTNTTNPSVATGDGIGIASRAGAALADMEFFQFHPTALYLEQAPRFLLSEALRGEGAYLLNMNQERFMPSYHEMAELAPRDVVARSIAHEIMKSHSPRAAVFLDMRHVHEDLAARFPRIYQTCKHYGLDLGKDLIPVRPAAHYMMGGIRTDLDGRCSLPGLYAAGEAACTGVHGANRLASNSLLEGLVFGARAAKAMVADSPASASAVPQAKIAAADDAQADFLRGEIQQLTWRNAGIIRSGESLQKLIHSLERLKPQLPSLASRASAEVNNLYLTAHAIAESALAREESRGAHYRTDFPDHNESYRGHSVIKDGEVSFVDEE